MHAQLLAENQAAVTAFRKEPRINYKSVCGFGFRGWMV